MAKKDVTIKEEQLHETINNNNCPPDNQDGKELKESDTIRNAHASGLGSIGRNEEHKKQDEEEKKY